MGKALDRWCGEFVAEIPCDSERVIFDTSIIFNSLYDLEIARLHDRLL